MTKPPLWSCLASGRIGSKKLTTRLISFRLAVGTSKRETVVESNVHVGSGRCLSLLYLAGDKTAQCGQRNPRQLQEHIRAGNRLLRVDGDSCIFSEPVYGPACGAAHKVRVHHQSNNGLTDRHDDSTERAGESG